MFEKHRVARGGVVDEFLFVGGRNRENETVDIGHVDLLGWAPKRARA
jgi:hypothetical protein